MNTLEILVLIIAISQGLLVLGVLGAVFYAIKTVGKISKQAQPAIDEARRIAESIHHIADNVGNRVEEIAATSDHMVHNVSKKVDRTTTMIQNIIENPLVRLASAGAGISKGYSVWTKWSKEKGENGHG